MLLDTTRVEREKAGRIAEEVISHASELVGANFNFALEISAEVLGGVPEYAVSIVTENGRTLQFDSQGFEQK